MPVIDLSVPLGPGARVFPGDPSPSLVWLNKPGSGGPSLTSASFGSHNSTHVDAPLHLFSEGLPVDGLSLDSLWGRARMVRLKSPKAGEMSSREISLSEALASGLPPSGFPPIVVVMTGFEPTGEDPWLYPHPSMELLDFLLAGGLKSYMTDAPGVDPASSASLPAHARLLGNGVPIVENLCNLGLLPINRDFTISALPIKLAGAEAAPCRAAAWLDP